MKKGEKTMWFEVKRVVELLWSSWRGWVEFRPVYAGGSVGPIKTTLIETSDPEKFLLRKKKIEGEWIGRVVLE